MKNIVKFTRMAAGLSFAALLCLSACKKDDTNEGGGGAPVISRIRTVSKTSTDTVDRPFNLDSTVSVTQVNVTAFDSTTTVGKLNTQYAIIGENLLKTTQVLVNGTSVYFNPALLTDRSIIFTVPAAAPWGADKENKIRVVTSAGSTESDFVIQQPPAIVTSLNPVAAGAGEIITINGSVFEGVTSVRFDDKEAEIVSSTPTQIRVKVPVGVVQAYIFVTTPGGTSRSVGSFGFKRLIFDDVLSPGFDIWGGWGGTLNVANPTTVKRGSRSMRIDYVGGYGSPLQFGYSGAALNFSEYTAVKISLYGGAGTEGKLVKLVFNGADGKELVLHEGVWTDYTIPLSEITKAANLTEIWLQEFSGNTPSIVYIDDFGLI
jgi:hypothetical protein